MKEKENKNIAFSPLPSNHIWSQCDKSNDWRVIGHSSLRKSSSRSIGEGSSGWAQPSADLWEVIRRPENIQRSVSTTAISELALRLELEKNDPTRRRAVSMLRDGFMKTERKSEREEAFPMRRHTLDPVLFSSGPLEETNLEVEDESVSVSGQKICIIQFGSGNKCFGVHAGLKLSKGVFVIIEADRGEDCGAVLFEFPAKDLAVIAQRYGISSMEVKHIYRIATEEDKLMLLEQNELEMEAVQWCKEKVKQKNLAMEIVGAEYQWDRHKLTFYFKSQKRIDFRDLIKELYKMYKTRIWMCAVEQTQENRLENTRE